MRVEDGGGAGGGGGAVGSVGAVTIGGGTVSLTGGGGGAGAVSTAIGGSGAGWPGSDTISEGSIDGSATVTVVTGAVGRLMVGSRGALG